ncbi:MAG: response regulator [Syntrophothermus sp.]|nr:response regulator [Ignavibacteriaceae bacterium]
MLDIKKPKKILIVEDERIIALDIKRTLNQLGYEVTSIIDNGIDVLTSIEENQPDLILMDIMLNSDLDGIDIANIINVKYDIPIIYMTALTDDATVKRAKESQYNEFVNKPFNEINLAMKIQKVLNSEIKKI